MATNFSPVTAYISSNYTKIKNTLEQFWQPWVLFLGHPELNTDCMQSICHFTPKSIRQKIVSDGTLLELQKSSGISSSIAMWWGETRLEWKSETLTCSRVVKIAALSTRLRLYSPPNTQWQIRFYREIDSISNPIECDKEEISGNIWEIFHHFWEQLTPELN